MTPASDPVQSPPPGGIRAATPYSQMRSAKRVEARSRIHDQVVHPIDAPQQLRDPLLRHSSPWATSIAGFRLFLAALMVHGLILAGFVLVNRLIGNKPELPPRESVVVEFKDPPPAPPPPPPEEQEEESGPVEPDFDEPTPVEPEPTQIPETNSPPKDLAEPEPEPSVEPPPSDTPAPPRRIVGLSLESTVSGGTGASFATGTSRMGATKKRAVDPQTAKKSPSGTGKVEGDSKGPGTREQRTASRIPTRGGVFVKPKRSRPSKPAFPATLKAQGIEGDVLVRVTIEADGSVSRVTVLQSSGHPAFDSAAKRDGKAVKFTLSYSYRFRIEN